MHRKYKITIIYLIIAIILFIISIITEEQIIPATGAGIIIGSLVERLKEYDKELKNKENIEAIIENYLLDEIISNLESIKGIIETIEKKKKDGEFESGSNCRQYGFLAKKLEYDEYNKIKHEIIKYDSKKVWETIEVYKIFYLLEKKRDTKKMNNEEIDELIKKYHKYS